ncbi:MAG: GNAT family N-acetyltransferase [Pirellulaceae bacterium]|nr:GNAT family N-acetyltransferase [Pirellulaceae bacterium]
MAKRQILVAKSGGGIVGYVLFSVNQKSEIRIAHLAVSSESRGKGISRLLINQLRSDYSENARIRLNCRADYVAAQVWHSLGFVVGKRMPGKKLDGSELIGYTLTLNDTPLFELSPSLPEQPLIVCDANVCIDIRYPSRPRHESASGLLADWLADQISIAVTEEVFNDLDRQDEPMRSEMISSIRTSWNVISSDIDAAERHRDALREIFGDPKDPSEISDQRHLAIAASRNAAAFATYDEELLKKAPDILGSLGLRVQRPSEIISELDSVVRVGIYQYREMRNTGIERHRVKSINELDLAEFAKEKQGESRRVLAAMIDGALSLPDRFEVAHIRDANQQSLAMILTEIKSASEKSLRIFRVTRRLAGTRLGNVISELLAYLPLGTANSPKGTILKIEDPHVEPSLLAACLRRGFQIADQQYIRAMLPGVWDHKSFLEVINEITDANGLPAVLFAGILGLADAAAGGCQTSTQRLEALIHPGKLAFGKLPTYVVPIQPEWAQELFDFRIWSRPLLSMDTRLVINPDSVYYKRPKNSPKGDNARILWYVSGSKQRGGGCIRACSVMTKGVTGTVKDLYREYQRLGVFEWRHLMDHFGNPDTLAFAMEFTNTELFPRTISLDELNAILIEDGMKRQQFISALEISQAAFETIYLQASRLD